MSANRSISAFPLITSTFSIFVIHGVLNHALCPKYKTKNAGIVIYAAKKFAADHSFGQKTWKPFVIVRITIMESA